MKIYIVEDSHLTSLVLPKSIGGNYQVKNKDNENLITISSKDNINWYANSDIYYKIYDGQNAVEEVLLTNYKKLIIHDVENGKNYLMIVAPVIEIFNTYTSDITKEIKIGSDTDSEIIYKSPLIRPLHATIKNVNNKWQIERDKDAKGIFINGKIMNGLSYSLLFGDEIFIYGFKIIFMPRDIYMNNPNNSISLKQGMFSIAIAKPKENIVLSEKDNGENIIKLYEEKDYFARKPAFSEKVKTEHFILDNHPAMPEEDDTPVLLTVGPMLTMAMSSVVTIMVAFTNYQKNGNLLSIIPTVVMGIGMLAGTLLWPSISRRYTKKKNREQRAKIEKEYSEYLNKKDLELKHINNSQKQIMLANNLSSIDCYNNIISRSPNLWKRELTADDFLTLRLGLGTVPVDMDYQIPEEHFTMEEDRLYNGMVNMVNANKDIVSAPVIENLVNYNILSIIGKHPHTSNYLKKLLFQILYLHSYMDLKIVLFTSEKYEEEWNDLKYVPHLFSTDKSMRFFVANDEDAKDVTQYISEIVNMRYDSLKDHNKDSYKQFPTYYLIITDNYDKVNDYPFISKIIEKDVNIGFSLIILKEDFASLPTTCEKFIGVNSYTEGGIVDKDLDKDKQKVFQIEQIDSVDAKLKYSGILLSNIPIEDTEEKFQLPTHYSFLEMFDVGNIEQLNIMERWLSNDTLNSLATPIGLNSNGNLFKLDLHEKAHGPHGLIAGMTGSGKSDFIITYILSLAVNYHPEDVQFVLIDYKGGGLVGAFINKEKNIKLPHVVGTITNLDKAEINRSLASLESELERRQDLFNKAKDKLNESTIDIYKYQRYYHEGLLEEPLAHLFIISDEFAELKSQQPEFIDKLISTARIGRSLGVHLILATQKPSGVVNDQIWSNARFKICLKVQDTSDSNEVIKRPDAAYLKNSGRFYIQVGYNEYFDLGQAAYSESNYVPQDRVYHEIDDDIEVINNIGKTIKNINVPKKQIEIKGQQLTEIVKYISNLSKERQFNIKQLWLDKIPEKIYLDTIKNEYNYQKKDFNINPVIGLYDNPREQKQGLVTLDLNNKGNVAIYSIDERNTITNTIIYSLITTYSTDELNLYILDFDSQTLKMYKEAPQVGDVLFIDEEDKMNYMFRMINEEFEKRKILFQDYNASYNYYIKNSGNTLPNIVIMIHGMDMMKETYEESVDELGRISRDGPKYGIYIIYTATSDRVMKMAYRSNFQQVIPLKLTQASDYNSLLGKKGPMISDYPNRGMILLNDNIYEFQTAVIGSEEESVEIVKEAISKLKDTNIKKVGEIKTIPEHISWKDILNEDISIEKIPIGIEKESLKTAYIDFSKTKLLFVDSVDIKSINSLYEIMTKNLINNGFNIIKIDGTSEERNLATLREESLKNNTIVFIKNVDDWIRGLSKEDQDTICDYFDDVVSLDSRIIIMDNIVNLKTYMFDKWYKRYIRKDIGIYIGKSLNDCNSFSVDNSFNEKKEAIPEGYAYNVIDGHGIRIKLVEDDINE